MRKNSVARLLLCVLMLGVWAGWASAGEKVCFDQENPPFMYQKGEAPTGLYPAIISEAFKRMNVPLTVECLPWNRVIAGADAGEWGVGGIYQNEERLKKYDYSAPIFEEKLMIFVMQGNEFSFNGVADLSGKTVGVMRGWSYGDAFDKAVASGSITKEEVESDEMNFKKLIAGRLDAIVAAPETWLGLKGALDKEGKVVMLSTPMTVNKTYLIFNKSAGKTSLLATFSQTVEAMKTEGVIETLAVENFK